MSALSARILNSLTHLRSFVLSLTPTSPLCTMPTSYETAWGSLCCSRLCRSVPLGSAVFHFLSLMSMRLLIPSFKKKKKSISPTSFKVFLMLATKIAVSRIPSSFTPPYAIYFIWKLHYLFSTPQYPIFA